MYDYYDGPEGVQRLMRELDQLLQQLLDNVQDARALDCSIQLTVDGAEPVRLDRTYRPSRRARPITGK